MSRPFTSADTNWTPPNPCGIAAGTVMPRCSTSACQPGRIIAGWELAGRTALRQNTTRRTPSRCSERLSKLTGRTASHYWCVLFTWQHYVTPSLASCCGVSRGPSGSAHLILSAVQAIFDRLPMAMKLSGSLSRMTICVLGIKQGCPLSPPRQAATLKSRKRPVHDTPGTDQSALLCQLF